MVNLSKSSLILGVVLLFIAGLLIGYVGSPLLAKTPEAEKSFSDKTVSEQREVWIAEANTIRGTLAAEGKYDCCLDKPCLYCIQKTPGHGEGATCECRDNILKGEHPCGECIGEILEGHGLKELKPYYAKAIAHKVGTEHEAHIQSIIDTMYPDEEETSSTTQ